VTRAHPLEDSSLEDVRVLVLIDEYLIVERSDPAADLGRRLQKHCPEEKEVVVIDEIALLLPRRVVGVDLPEVLDVVNELRIVVAEYVFDEMLVFTCREYTYWSVSFFGNRFPFAAYPSCERDSCMRSAESP
jgi:hypothetical protein